MSETTTYSVPGVHCAHCEAAIQQELAPVPGVTAIDVDLAAKTVSVTGEALDDEQLRAAIDRAGYDIA